MSLIKFYHIPTHRIHVRMVYLYLHLKHKNPRWFSRQICEHSTPLNCNSPPEVWCLFVCYPVPHRHSCASWRTSERKRGIQERSWTHEMSMKKKMMMMMMMMMMMAMIIMLLRHPGGSLVLNGNFIDWISWHLDHSWIYQTVYSTLRPCPGVLNRQCSRTFWLKTSMDRKVVWVSTVTVAMWCLLPCDFFLMFFSVEYLISPCSTNTFYFHHPRFETVLRFIRRNGTLLVGGR